MKEAHDLVIEAKQNVTEVSIDQAPIAIEGADLLIDVREPSEYNAGHIAGAVNIPRGLLEFKMSSTPECAARDLKLVLYCKTSGRAALSAQSLQAMGYTQVISIGGGFDAWAESGHPVDKPQKINYE